MLLDCEAKLLPRLRRQVCARGLELTTHTTLVACAMSADPFLAVQGEVTQQLKEVERMQASYLRAAGSSREAAGAALGALLAEVEQDLDDLTGTIAAVAANPARF